VEDFRTQKVLLTGATGYVGGKLLAFLEAQGEAVVYCLARNPTRICKTLSTTRVFKGDLIDFDSVQEAFEGISVAFYLVHSLDENQNFSEVELVTARNFGRAAQMAGVERIIYLGGLGDDQASSDHLKSRHAVGEALRSFGVPVIEFRAAIIIGAGSTSYQILAELTEKLPMMICPRWVLSKTQPIAIGDVIKYLAKAINVPLDGHNIYEIGGSDLVCYRDLMLEYARQRGLRRLIIPVPVLTPYLSALWLALVTSWHAKVGRKLIEGLRTDTVVASDTARKDFGIEPCSLDDAFKAAFQEEAEAITHPNGIRKDCRVCHRLPRISVKLDVGRDSANLANVGDTLVSQVWQVSGLDSKLEWNKIAETNERVVYHSNVVLLGDLWLRVDVDSNFEAKGGSVSLICRPRGLLGRLKWYLAAPRFGRNIRMAVLAVREGVS
jgi:uncharacterized protein YbjT (DUF2867 family)